MRGLGDLIKFLLQPLEPLIRRFYGKKGCGCRKRQEVLNEKFPNPFMPTPRKERVSLTSDEIFQKKFEQYAKIGRNFEEESRKT